MEFYKYGAMIDHATGEGASFTSADYYLMAQWIKACDEATKSFLVAYNKYKPVVLPRNGKTYKESNRRERLTMIMVTIQNDMGENPAYEGDFDWLDELAGTLAYFFDTRAEFMKEMDARTDRALNVEVK